MEKFIAAGFSAQNIPGYSCDIPRQPITIRRELFGIVNIIYGILAELVYALALSVMFYLQRVHKIYSLMFILGLYDMVAIAVASLLTGYFNYVGAEYCTFPNLIYISGAVGLGVWAGSCLFCLILVWNRILDLWNPTIAEIIFGKQKMWIWISVAVMYSLYFFFFTPPIIFNSVFRTWLTDPLITGTPEEQAMHHNYSYSLHNILVVCLICLSYVLLGMLLPCRYKDSINHLSQFQNIIVLQAVLICSANLIASLIAVYINYFPGPDWIPILGHSGWALGHGIPGIVYLTLNKSIRRELLKRFPMFRKTTISTSQGT